MSVWICLHLHEWQYVIIRVCFASICMTFVAFGVCFGISHAGAKLAPFPFGWLVRRSTWMTGGCCKRWRMHLAGHPQPSWQRLVFGVEPGVIWWEVSLVLSQPPLGTTSSCCTSPDFMLGGSQTTVQMHCRQTCQLCYRRPPGAIGRSAGVLSGIVQQKK